MGSRADMATVVSTLSTDKANIKLGCGTPGPTTLFESTEFDPGPRQGYHCTFIY